jgi:phosphonopyruvate decarboxylase
VPDSLLKGFCASLAQRGERDLIAANEGAAVALATGHYLATGRPGMVYMQNSGLGNALNPLTSLVDPEVYGIPMLLLIGWRGEPDRPDEPQHAKQGRVTLPMLETLGIPHEIHPDDLGQVAGALERALAHAEGASSPYALVVREGTFGPYDLQEQPRDPYEMRREEAVIGVTKGLHPDDVIVSTTGKASRELFEQRTATGASHAGDFLTVGSMGHASQIALGIALARPGRQVLCLDGDGALIMHMGALAIIGTRGPRNFKHVVINNGAHDSVGGQSTAGHSIDIPAIARACGYHGARRVVCRDELASAVVRLREEPGPALLEIMASRGARADLGRPTVSPRDNKLAFMENLSR